MTNFKKSIATALLAAAVGAGSAYAQDNADCVPAKAKPTTTEKVAGDTAGQVTQQVGKEASQQAREAVRDFTKGLGGFGSKVFGKAADGAVRQVSKDATKAATETAKDAAVDAVKSDKPVCEEPKAREEKKQKETPTVVDKATETATDAAVKEGQKQLRGFIKGLKF